MSKLPFIFGIICFLIYQGLKYLTGDPILSSLIFLVPFVVLLINISLRKKLRYKSWFLSHLNLILERKTRSISSDISADLLFEKVTELAKESSIQLFDVDHDTKSLLLGSSANFLTWGENMYVEVIEKSEETSEIKFISTTIFGSSSWKRNTSNCDTFVQTFEQSLTI